MAKNLSNTLKISVYVIQELSTKYYVKDFARSKSILHDDVPYDYAETTPLFSRAKIFNDKPNLNFLGEFKNKYKVIELQGSVEIPEEISFRELQVTKKLKEECSKKVKRLEKLSNKVKDDYQSSIIKLYIKQLTNLYE